MLLKCQISSLALAGYNRSIHSLYFNPTTGYLTLIGMDGDMDDGVYGKKRVSVFCIECSSVQTIVLWNLFEANVDITIIEAYAHSRAQALVSFS